jgi:hypothetical protein
MENKQTIPEDYIEFLHWLKQKTEARWGEKVEEGKEPHWIQDAKWIGMTDDEIDSVEKRYSVRFMPEHRQFLKILHAIDRKEINESEDNGVICKSESPFYYNWLSDDEEIRDMLEWPHREILRDVLGANGLWLKSWGEKVESDEEKTKIFNDWFRKTPKLLPLTSDCFLVSDETLTDRPVLSVWGSDIMVYAWSLKHFLLHEFCDTLDLMNYTYDEEGELCHVEYGDELGEINEKEYELSMNKHIPFFKEIILYWS